MTKPFGADIRLLAVDLDGTLVDSAPDLDHCLGDALEAARLPRPREDQTRSWVGDGVEELIRRALANAVPGTTPDTFRATAAPKDERFELFEAAFADFSACYEQNLFRRSTLYPGVVETLDFARARGLRLACITNKRLRFAEGVLQQAGIRDRFELVLGGDSVPEKKPSPALLHAAAEASGVPPSASTLAGDSYQDFHAARAAGWSFIWAAYGYCAAIDARPSDTVTVIRRFDEIIELLVSSGPP